VAPWACWPLDIGELEARGDDVVLGRTGEMTIARDSLPDGLEAVLPAQPSRLPDGGNVLDE
jgi:hypothetical protein